MDAMFATFRVTTASTAAVLFVLAISCWQKELAAQPPENRPPLIEAKAMTLQELTDEADKIFEGKVTKVETKEFELTGKGGKKVKVRGHAITFQVNNKIKGNVTVGEPLEVNQTSAAYLPLKVGDEVLWYLSKPGQSGFTAPLGIYSGNFKIKPDPSQPASKIAVNLTNNVGLWSAHHSLVDSTNRLAKGQFSRVLDSKRASLAPGRTERILQVASQPNHPGPLPLELVVSATQSLLTQ
jgi:hypothetical protein